MKVFLAFLLAVILISSVIGFYLGWKGKVKDGRKDF